MKDRIIKIDNPKRITVKNLLRKVREEAPNGAELTLKFNAPEIPIKWEMVIWFGFFWEDDIPSDDPVWFYTFKGTSQTNTFHEKALWSIMEKIDTYMNLGTIEQLTATWEDWDSDEE